MNLLTKYNLSETVRVVFKDKSITGRIGKIDLSINHTEMKVEYFIISPDLPIGSNWFLENDVFNN